MFKKSHPLQSKSEIILRNIVVLAMVVFFTVFLIIPIGIAFAGSFHEWNPLSGTYKFLGLENYKHGQISMGSNRSISTYDSEEETFRVHFTVNGKMVSGEIHVPIDIAQSFKEDFPSVRVTYGKKWVFIGDRLYPKSLFIEDRSIVFSCDLPLAYTESSDINIAFDELGVSNTYLKGYVFHLDKLTSGYESDMGERSPYESKCYDVVEEMPSFPGGQE